MGLLLQVKLHCQVGKQRRGIRMMEILPQGRQRRRLDWILRLSMLSLLLNHFCLRYYITLIYCFCFCWYAPIMLYLLIFQIPVPKIFSVLEVVGLENRLGNDSWDFIYLFYLLICCTANWMCLVYELVYGSLPFRSCDVIV